MQRVNEEVKIDKRKVFVIHGRNGEIRHSIFDLLRAIGLSPIEWSQAVALTKKGAPFVGEILDAAFGQAQAVVAMLTGDDLARLRPDFCTPNDKPYDTQLTPQARPNVLFEAGMALAMHPDRTVLVQVGEVRPFSDIEGRHFIRLDNTSEKRQELANRLRTAGCMVDSTGTDWLTKGHFEVKIPTVPAGLPVHPASLESLQRSFAYGQCVLGGFQKLISQITPLSDATISLLHRKDKARPVEVFEEIFKKYTEYYLKSFAAFLHALPELKAPANTSIQLFSSCDLTESFNRLEFSIDPFEMAERRIRQWREVALVRYGGLNDEENNKLCGAIMNLHAICGSVVLNTHDYLRQLMNTFFITTREDRRE